MTSSRIRFEGARPGSPLISALGLVLLATSIAFSQASAADSQTSKTAMRESVAVVSEADGAGRRESYLLFPRRELFKPLIADMRWPRFSAEYQWRFDTDQFSRVAAVSLGETFALVRSPQHDWGEWELGFQAMVDAIFDMDSSSSDLSNEDYFVGLTGSVLRGGVTSQVRLYHFSSHLGDEYLIENGLTRDGVSFEVIDLLASYEPYEWMRLYGGGGVLIDSSPTYDRVVTQFGVEMTSPVGFASGLLRPIFGGDFQLRQENDWRPEAAVLAGLRLADPADDVRHLDFYARYYHGRSPDGQFFDQTIDSFGLGARLGF
ncbi:MAG: hypothetical protein CL908_03320 [Deltaproteobacteria bacterium]|nr:hypothetical protein [Deltaproteobacteria bacterium]